MQGLEECVHPVLFVPSASGVFERRFVMANFLWFTLFAGVNLFQ